MKMVMLEVNPDYKPETADEKKAYAAIRESGGGRALKRPIPYVTALENVVRSEGMLRFKTEQPKTGVKIETSLEDMPTEQLKIMMLTAGVTPTKKQMGRAEIIQSIRTKMAAFEVVDDDAEG